MPAFDTILEAARRRVGEAELRARMPAVSTAEALRAVADDRYLSLMSRRIFRAGLKHSVVDTRWPAFEEAFRGFDLRRVRAMNDEEIEALMNDRRLIRHWGKIKSVRSNAAAMQQVAEERGGFGAYLAGWPESDMGRSRQAVPADWRQLRPLFPALGRQGYVHPDALGGRGAEPLEGVPGTPKTKADRAKVQAVLNAWAGESGLPLAHVSMTLALSVD